MYKSLDSWYPERKNSMFFPLSMNKLLFLHITFFSNVAASILDRARFFGMKNLDGVTDFVYEKSRQMSGKTRPSRSSFLYFLFAVCSLFFELGCNIHPVSRCGDTPQPPAFRRKPSTLTRLRFFPAKAKVWFKSQTNLIYRINTSMGYRCFYIDALSHPVYLYLSGEAFT